MGQDCATAGICVDLYLFPSAYTDVATIGMNRIFIASIGNQLIFGSLGALSALTGGDIYNYTNFEVNRDGQRFVGDVKRSLSRSFGYDALLRIRVSTGTSHILRRFCI